MSAPSQIKHDLCGLATELIHMIAGKLSSREDLKALSLTCYGMAAISRGFLYEEPEVTDDNITGFLTTLLLKPEYESKVKCLTVNLESIDAATSNWAVDYRMMRGNNPATSLADNNTQGDFTSAAIAAMGPAVTPGLKAFWLNLIHQGNTDAAFALLLCVVPRLPRLQVITKCMGDSGFGFMEHVLGLASGHTLGLEKLSILKNLKEVSIVLDSDSQQYGHDSFAALALLLAAPALQNFSTQALTTPNRLHLLPEDLSIKNLSVQTYESNPVFIASIVLSSQDLKSLNATFAWATGHTENWFDVVVPALLTRANSLECLSLAVDTVNAFDVTNFTGMPVLIEDLSALRSLTYLKIPQFVLIGFPAFDPASLHTMGDKPFWSRLPRSLVRLELSGASSHFVDYLRDLTATSNSSFPRLIAVTIHFVELGSNDKETGDFEGTLLQLRRYFRTEMGLVLGWTRPTTPDEELSEFFKENEEADY